MNIAHMNQFICVILLFFINLTNLYGSLSERGRKRTSSRTLSRKDVKRIKKEVDVGQGFVKVKTEDPPPSPITVNSSDIDKSYMYARYNGVTLIQPKIEDNTEPTISESAKNGNSDIRRVIAVVPPPLNVVHLVPNPQVTQPATHPLQADLATQQVSSPSTNVLQHNLNIRELFTAFEWSLVELMGSSKRYPYNPSFEEKYIQYFISVLDRSHARAVAAKKYENSQVQ